MWGWVSKRSPFLALIPQLIRRGVEVRLIHAKEPGPNFCEDFDKYPVPYDRLERVLCPQFDEVGIGKQCKKCKLKGSCPDPY